MTMGRKLLVFCPYYPPHVGGLESHADEFNKHLSRKGYRITVFTPRLPESASEHETKYNDVEIIRFPAFELIPNWFLPKFWDIKYWTLRQEIYKNNFDVIISRTRFFFTSVMAMHYAKKKNTKWVHIEHGSDYVQLSNKLNSLFARVFDHTFGKLVLKNANDVVANSNASARFCQKIYSKRSYDVIYRGVEIEEIERVPTDKKISTKYKDVLKIIFTGRLIDGKGVADLLRAVSRLSFDKWALFVVGDGPQKKELEDLAKTLHIGNKVVFFGQKTKEDLIGILRASDIMINPSYTEGLPTSVIEAAICGKVIIATDVGGTNEIFENSENALIPPRSPSVITEKIEYFASNEKERRVFGAKVSKEIKEKFGWSSSIDKYLKILNKND